MRPPRLVSLTAPLLLIAALGGCAPRLVHDEWSPGVPKRTGQLVGGKQDGQWTYWYSSGAKQAEGAWSSDFQDGPWTWWYANGQRQQTGVYQGSGLSNRSSAPRVGRWQFWYDNGQLSSAGAYRDDRQDGRWEFFARDGRPYAAGTFTAGVKDLAWTWWHANGAPREAGTYDQGLKVGRWTTWSSEGVMATVTDYSVDGKVVAHPPVVVPRPVAPPIDVKPVATTGPVARPIEPPPLDVRPVAPAVAEAVKPAVEPAAATTVVAVVKPAEPDLTLPPVDAPSLSPVPTSPQLWTATQEGNAATLVRRYATGEVPPAGYDESAFGEGNRQKRDLLGKPLARRRLLTSTGNVLDLGDYVGRKPVVLVILRGFSGQVCLYCATQTTALSNNIGKFNDLGAEVIIVYPGPVEALPAFVQAVQSLRKDPPPMLLGLDASLLIVRALGIEDNLAKPTSLIIDKEGKVRYAYVGKTIADRPAVNDLLQEAAKYVK
jgi:antitoxin component YwqK of YwqJK toxin-antitoxin module/peroxiredoxin